MIAETNSKTVIFSNPAILQSKVKGAFISENKPKICSVNLESRYNKQ